MPQTLALIHTSQVFLKTETLIWDLFAQIMPDVRLLNIMDDSLLPHCMAQKGITPEVTRRMCAYVVAAESAGADAVLSLCSSLGPTIDVARTMVSIPVIKIDDAHTEEAVRRANRIGVVATVGTTLKPTVALLREKASAAGKDVEIQESLAPGAFEALTRGDRDRHDQLIEEAARTLAPNVDLLLFAQASMTRLAPRVEEATRVPVLTSPRPAVQLAKRVLDGLKQRSA
jgi:Asp/Glu/hydantoin racemase